MEDPPSQEKELEKYEFLILNKADVPDYLRRLSFPSELIDILMRQEMNKPHPVRKTTPALMRVRLGKPMGIDLFWTNSIQHCIEKNAKALCDFVYLKDTTEKMIDT